MIFPHNFRNFQLYTYFYNVEKSIGALLVLIRPPKYTLIVINIFKSLIVKYVHKIFTCTTVQGLD